MDNKDELTFELQKALAEKEIMDKVNVRVRRKTSLVLLFISFMSLVLVTFAWFTISTLANVEKLDMTIGTAPDLRISTENHGSNLKSDGFSQASTTFLARSTPPLPPSQNTSESANSAPLWWQ